MQFVVLAFACVVPDQLVWQIDAEVRVSEEELVVVTAEPWLQVLAKVVEGLIVDLPYIFQPCCHLLLLSFKMYVDERKGCVIEGEAN